MKTVAIIQARMGATRLPNKMMLHLHGYPVIEWVVRRVKRAQKLDQVVVAIPDTEKDNILQFYLEKIGALVFRGSENDVLERFYQAAKFHKADNIVRVCADNPLISATEIDNLIEFFFQNNCDYAYNHIPLNNKYPDGLGAEIVPFSILEKIYSNAKSERNREHIFTYITDNTKRFSIKTFDPSDPNIAFPEIKLDMDNYQDYNKFLSIDLNINMSASEIVASFRKQP